MRLRGAEDVFQHSKEEYTDCVRSEVRVGKLSKDAFKPESPKEERTEAKLQVPGKISTKELFARAEANSEELLREVRVGKLTQDRLTLTSSTDLDSLERTEPDVNIAPTGGVQEKASAFSTPKAKSPPKLSCPKIKRSESSLESDMQKKYQQQLASTALKRGNSTAALVVKKEGKETVLKVDKVAQIAVADDDLTDDMQRKYQQQLASTALKRGNSSASVVVKRDPSLRKETLLKVEPVAKKRAPVQDDEMTVGEMLRTPAEPRVEAGKMQEARSSFFSSMIAASTSSSTAPASVQRLGTSIVPAVTAEDREKFEKAEISKQQSKGKALFQRRKEKEREEEEQQDDDKEEEERLAPVELLPGVDMDEMRMTVRLMGETSC